MGTIFKSRPDLMEPKGMGWLSLLMCLLLSAAALGLAWRAPSLNNVLFRDNKNTIPLTGSLWILTRPEAEAGEETSGKKLFKIAEPAGSPTAPGVMYIIRFQDGLMRPVFFFDKLPLVEAANQQPLLPFRYQIDDSTERRAVGVIQGRRVMMLLPAKGDFDDLGPELLAAAARGRRLRVSLELKPDWIFEANYDVSELGLALDQFKKDRRQP